MSSFEFGCVFETALRYCRTRHSLGLLEKLSPSLVAWWEIAVLGGLIGGAAWKIGVEYNECPKVFSTNNLFTSFSN